MNRGLVQAPLASQPPALTHHFTKGIRFDTEVQYLQSGAKVQRWRNMPSTWTDWSNEPGVQHGQDEPSSPQCMAICLVQCLSALGYPGMGLVKRQAPPDLSEAPSLERWLQSQGLVLRTQVLSSPQPEMIGASIGAYALDAVQSGAACAVCIESSNWQRWVWLAGVEAMSMPTSIPRPSQQARALLVLDGMGRPPWGCGHNARIELGARGGFSRSSHQASHAGAPTPQLIYRHLDGQAAMVRLRSLISLSK